MTKKIKISQSGDYFIDEKGQKFFYLADTVWSAFTNATLEEWEEYLDVRKSQGFNALQINVLRQHDASDSELNLEPFAKKSDGTYDFSKINEQYFERAKKMVKMATDRGFVPVLVLLWANYVKDTLFAQPGKTMPFSEIEPYVEYVVTKFAEFNPMYFISGDTNFETEDTVKHYLKALETVKTITPEALITLHLWGKEVPHYDLPESIFKNDKLDFFSYQSGHGDWTKHPYKLAQQFYDYPGNKPIVNTEPCYEGIGQEWGRIMPANIRRATWLSLLSGAKAGIGYGAHGLWCWHRKELKPIEWGFKNPFDWKAALNLKGARDVAYAKSLFEQFDLFDIEPSDKVVNDDWPIRLSLSEDKMVLYIPYSTNVTLDMDLKEYNLTLINLHKQQILEPEIEYKEGKSIVKQYQFNNDALLIGKK